MSNTYLIELGTEELPPKSLLELSSAFSKEIIQGLQAAQLSFKNTRQFATPRRLGLLIEDLSAATPKTQTQIWGPPKQLAINADGSLSKAGEGFCQRNGIEASALQWTSDGKVEKIFCLKQEGGVSTKSLLPDLVNLALNKLPIAKRMRWGSGRIEFVRPLHWLVLLCDGEIIPATVYGLKSDRITQGHRFHCPQALSLAQAKDYETCLLEQGKVVASFESRRENIQQQVHTLAKQQNAEAIIDPELLDEVTALVEWPVALAGHFDEAFLKVPAEALISSMKAHQKYFHLVDKQGALKPSFITVANIAARDPALVIAGNEKVIRPRLSDAAFFFETDKKLSLAARREKLRTVLFQAQLGSLFDKTERVKSLAVDIAKLLKWDSTLPARAAELSKSDLVSSMVYEFPEMQGIAGEHYALNDGEDKLVARAIREQYLPRFSGDALPESQAGIILALADRLDTLIGIFAIGQSPTGSKDPFALRRASVSVLRLLIEKALDLDLRDLLGLAAAKHSDLNVSQDALSTTLTYVLDRIPALYGEKIAVEVFQALDAKALSHPLDLDLRIKAVSKFSSATEAPSLAAANKRVANILAKLEQLPSGSLNVSLLQDAAEKTLAAEVKALQEKVLPLVAAREYESAFSHLATLRGSLDTFFDEVMVMCDDLALRENRLILLATTRNLFLQIADISYLAIAK